MVSGGGELQCEVEEGRCWDGVGGSEGRLGGRFIGREGYGRWPVWEGHGQHRNLTINGGRDAPGQGASCEGEGTARRRTGAAAGRTPAWRARVASTQWRSEQQRPWRDAGGAMQARVHSQQWGQRAQPATRAYLNK
jgi:hypothetical protein